MTATLVDKGLKQIQAKMKRLEQLGLTLGFQGDKAQQLYETGINVATAATFAEFGTQDAPARSFLRAAMFEFRDKIAKLWASGVERMLATRISAETMLEQVGREIVKLIERKIEAARSWAKPNAVSTVRGKGFDFPLHDTFFLSRSVTWAVRDRSGAILSIGGSRG
jgi:hypothetical protein